MGHAAGSGRKTQRQRSLISFLSVTAIKQTGTSILINGLVNTKTNISQRLFVEIVKMMIFRATKQILEKAIWLYSIQESLKSREEWT